MTLAQRGAIVKNKAFLLVPLCQTRLYGMVTSSYQTPVHAAMYYLLLYNEKSRTIKLALCKILSRMTIRCKD